MLAAHSKRHPSQTSRAPCNVGVNLRISLDCSRGEARARRVEGISPAQLFQTLAYMFQPPLDLAALAPYEKVYAIVLRLEDFQELVPEGLFGARTLSRDRDGFVCTGRGLVLDEIFKVVVVDVVCVASRLASAARIAVGDGTHNGPILVSTVGARCLRISCPRFK